MTRSGSVAVNVGERVALRQRHARAWREALAVEIGAVAAVEILDGVAAPLPMDAGVLPADGLRAEADGRIELAAQYDDRIVERIVAPQLRPFECDEQGHMASTREESS
jgi:hypothetical protein